VTGQGGDGPAELTPEQRDRVLAQVAERRRHNEERIAELGIDLSREGIAAAGEELLRDRIARQRAGRAEASGQLDFDGAA
jgi:hypothetical protein